MDLSDAIFCTGVVDIGKKSLTYVENWTAYVPVEYESGERKKLLVNISSQRHRLVQKS